MPVTSLDATVALVVIDLQVGMLTAELGQVGTVSEPVALLDR